MSQTHWKKLTNPNYLGAYAFEPGEEKVVTITECRQEPVMGESGKEDVCIVCHFDAEKPMIMNKTNCKAISKLLGTPYIEEWSGKSLVLVVQMVKAFGDMTEAVRVSSKKPQMCDACGCAIKPAAGKSVRELIDIGTQKYGKRLCVECMKKAKEELKNG